MKKQAVKDLKDLKPRKKQAIKDLTLLEKSEDAKHVKGGVFKSCATGQHYNEATLL